jgi:hypothetical protein
LALVRRVYRGCRAVLYGEPDIDSDAPIATPSSITNNTSTLGINTHINTSGGGGSASLLSQSNINNGNNNVNNNSGNNNNNSNNRSSSPLNAYHAHSS